VSATLTAANKQQILIPGGFAHGFLVLSENAEFLYKCSEFYRSEDEHGILWSDPDLGIAWNIATPLLSAKDSGYSHLRAVARQLLPAY